MKSWLNSVIVRPKWHRSGKAAWSEPRACARMMLVAYDSGIDSSGEEFISVSRFWKVGTSNFPKPGDHGFQGRSTGLVPDYEYAGMDLKLGGRSVLVTGGSKGIGLAIARGFASEGCKLWLVARSGSRLEQA